MIQHQNKKNIYIHDMMILRSEKKMKNKKYHTVTTVLKSNKKTKTTTLSEQF